MTTHPTSSLLGSPELLARARRGDRDAIGGLWEIYQPQLLRLLQAGGCPSPDDVASQTWIDVGRGLADFEGDGEAFRRWLFTIARRRQIDAGRRSTRRRDRPVAEPEQVMTAAQALAPIGADEHLERAKMMLGKLPARQAQAVLLRVVYELEVEDVAEILDVSPGNARVLVHRGLATLRRRLDDAGGSESQLVRLADDVASGSGSA